MNTLLSLLLLSALSSNTAHANTSGKTGSSTTGCTSCHGSSPSSATTVAITASPTVAPGETITVEVEISHARQSKAGFNASATGGTFTAGTGSKVSSGEITHSSAQTMASGAYTFSFDWTAPTTLGTYTVYAAGNAVDGDRSSSGDAWNKTSTTILVAESCLDEDTDSITDCDGDCDDTNADIYPGATEICDGLDNNCDSVVDEGLTSMFYLDLDTDGFGDPAVTRQGCSAPTGYTDNGEDCDDSDSDIYPGATEIPDDGIDQDCDGSDATSGGGDDTGGGGGGGDDTSSGGGGGDTDEDEDTDTPDDKDDDGCSTVGGSASAVLALMALLGVGRRRHRPDRHPAR